MFRNAVAAAVAVLFSVTAASAWTAEPPSKTPVDVCTRADRAPAPLSPALARVVGQYGTTDAILDISEHCGSLVANGHAASDEKFEADKLDHIGRSRGFVITGDLWHTKDWTLLFDLRRSTAHVVFFGDETLIRHDFGAEVEARIHAEVHADPDKVRKAALAATPPKEPAPKRASELVPLTSLDPTIHVDTIYASTRNFMGIPIYERAGAYVQRPAAEAVARASKALHKFGYGLLVTDAYRPWYATKMFWDATPPEDHNFVADPSQGSRHNRGCAVDLTLYDLKTSKPVEMTGRIDEMSARSIADYPGGTTRQRWFRALLRQAMEAQDFNVYPDEWWHFDYKDWADYGIGTATYTDLDAGRSH